MIPRIKFRQMTLEENIELVKWSYFENKGPLDIHSYTIQLFPKLNNLDKNLSKTEIFLIIEEAVTKQYNKKINKIMNDVKDYNTIWKSYNDIYFKALCEYLNIEWPKDKKIIEARVGILPIFPRYLDSFSFDISVGLEKNKIKEVAAHESLHFIWFEKWKQLYPKTKRKEFDSPYLIWQYSEMVTDTILNTPNINKTIKVKEKSYDSFYELYYKGQNVMMKINKIFSDNIQIEDKIKKGYEYLLSVYNKM